MEVTREPVEVQSAPAVMPALPTGMTLRAYFAAHAPDVPGDFQQRRKTVVVDTGMGLKRIESGLESRLEWIVRWRLEYADAMIKAFK